MRRRIEFDDGSYVEINDANNYTCYYDNNDFSHRDDGPCCDHNGNLYYMIHGRYHREDGPAVDIKGSKKFQEWWIHGKKLDCVSNEEFFKLMKLKSFW
jgi:hypothetical protein